MAVVNGIAGENCSIAFRSKSETQCEVEFRDEFVARARFQAAAVTGSTARKLERLSFAAGPEQLLDRESAEPLVRRHHW